MRAKYSKIFYWHCWYCGQVAFIAKRPEMGRVWCDDCLAKFPSRKDKYQSL